MPSVASVWYYFRELDYPHIKELREIGDSIAQGAAMMTNTTVSSRVLGSAWPLHFNKPVAEVMYENIKQVGLPQWSEADQALAKAVQRELKVPERGLDSKLKPLKGPVSEDRRTARRFRRHRRRLMECPDGHPAISVEPPQSAGSSLVERDHHGDAHRP